jgi:hypothetical protein
MVAVPRSARLVAWGNAWLRGSTSLDEAAARVCGSDEPHRVHGLPGQLDPLAMTVALGRLRGWGVESFRLALPVAGDPLGLCGPAEFTRRAVDVGEAVLAVGDNEAIGLVPDIAVHGPNGDTIATVRWDAEPVHCPAGIPLPTVAEADRELSETLRDATARLAALDVARWRPDLAEALVAVRRLGADGDALAPGYPPRAVQLLASARRLAAVAALAQVDDGASVSAGEMAARRDALRPLERATRRAQVAAYNAVLEPS